MNAIYEKRTSNIHTQQWKTEYLDYVSILWNWILIVSMENGLCRKERCSVFLTQA